MNVRENSLLRSGFKCNISLVTSNCTYKVNIKMHLVFMSRHIIACKREIFGSFKTNIRDSQGMKNFYIFLAQFLNIFWNRIIRQTCILFVKYTAFFYGNIDVYIYDLKMRWQILIKYWLKTLIIKGKKRGFVYWLLNTVFI